MLAEINGFITEQHYKDCYFVFLKGFHVVAPLDFCVSDTKIQALTLSYV